MRKPDQSKMSVPGDNLPLPEMKGAMTKQSKPRCPVCGWETLPIAPGLPGAVDFERTAIISAGSIAEETSPDLCCSNCDWSGQQWHIGAPLPPRVWIVTDSEALRAPIGLVTGRYDQIYEIFLFGYWHNISVTKQYLAWLSELSEEPKTFTAPFDDLSPALIADFRRGSHLFEPGDLQAAGLVGWAGGAPKFSLDGWSDPFPIR
jgi:hypothetical protein